MTTAVKADEYVVEIRFLNGLWAWRVNPTAPKHDYWALHEFNAANGLSFTKWGALRAARRACRRLAESGRPDYYERWTWKAER